MRTPRTRFAVSSAILLQGLMIFYSFAVQNHERWSVMWLAIVLIVAIVATVIMTVVAHADRDEGE